MSVRATKFVASGHRINQLLSARADVPKAARKLASVLRSESVGMLGRVRADLSRKLRAVSRSVRGEPTGPSGLRRLLETSAQTRYKAIQVRCDHSVSPNEPAPQIHEPHRVEFGVVGMPKHVTKPEQLSKIDEP